MSRDLTDAELDARDRADDELLANRERSELHGWRESQAEHHHLEDIWGPAPGDLEPTPTLHDYRTRR